MTRKEQEIAEHLLRAGFIAGYRATVEHLIESLTDFADQAEADGDHPYLDARAMLRDLEESREKPPPEVEVGHLEPGETPEQYAKRMGIQ